MFIHLPEFASQSRLGKVRQSERIDNSESETVPIDGPISFPHSLYQYRHAVGTKRTRKLSVLQTQSPSVEPEIFSFIQLKF